MSSTSADVTAGQPAPSTTPLLGSPSHVVVGASDVAGATRFYEAFGFTPSYRRTLDPAAAQALYGVAAPLEEVELSTPGADSGHLLLVSSEPDPDAPEHDPYERGAHALDVYTTDAEGDQELARSAGGRPRGTGTLALGPLVMHHAVVLAPDDAQFVLLDANRRRPSVLDDDPGRRHSEVHSLLWAVDDIDIALPFWRDEAGLVVGLDVPVAGPEVAAMLGLPDGDVTLRMALLSDAAVTPARLELLQYVDRPGPDRPSWPLTPGLHAPAFAVADLDAAVAALPSARFGAVADAGGGEPADAARPWRRAVSGVAPGGVRFLLWQS